MSFMLQLGKSGKLHNQWKQVISGPLIIRVQKEQNARRCEFPVVIWLYQTSLHWKLDVTFTSIEASWLQGWTDRSVTRPRKSTETWLTDRLEWWPQLSVDWLKQVIVIKIQNKLFKVLQPLHVGRWAVTLLQVLLWGAKASLHCTALPFMTVVVGARLIVRAPLSLALLSLNVCHLHGRKVLLSSSLQVEALLIQGFQLLNAVARPGSPFWWDWVSAGTTILPRLYYSCCAQRTKEPICWCWNAVPKPSSNH